MLVLLSHILLCGLYEAMKQGSEPEHQHHTLITVFYLQGHSPRDKEQSEGHDEDDDEDRFLTEFNGTSTIACVMQHTDVMGSMILLWYLCQDKLVVLVTNNNYYCFHFNLAIIGL